MAQREASGDFDYLIDDTVDVEDAADSGAQTQADFFDPEKAPGRDMRFDAFDADTWYFEPSPPPWYRTRLNLCILIAAAIAAIALVVSVVLLVVRAPEPAVDRNDKPVRPSVQTTAPPRTPSPRNESPPPPPPPPPPREDASPPPAAPPPPATYRPRTPAPRSGREPEIGVTRTPVTRSPISVAPQRPGQR
ncbi:hypothetical protein A5698_11015 [Mycobacterium sp. E136]|uniref:hypothetical protein n=1 Tax=Mycobacterium sp. E136 TaxID=1834125 RepID=UPI0007FE9ABD|nr:hypothetical protein [Mycobacterium sp. E136]OBG98979.1 hypothetical protein A5698_11015 [Mycobacterium sp. E136]